MVEQLRFLKENFPGLRRMVPMNLGAASDFVGWLEDKLREHDLTAKVLPDERTIRQRAAQYTEEAARERVEHELRASLEWDALVDRGVADLLAREQPIDIGQLVEALCGNPPRLWSALLRGQRIDLGVDPVEHQLGCQSTATNEFPQYAFINKSVLDLPTGQADLKQFSFKTSHRLPPLKHEIANLQDTDTLQLRIGMMCEPPPGGLIILPACLPCQVFAPVHQI